MIINHELQINFRNIRSSTNLIYTCPPIWRFNPTPLKFIGRPKLVEALQKCGSALLHNINNINTSRLGSTKIKPRINATKQLIATRCLCKNLIAQVSRNNDSTSLSRMFFVTFRQFSLCMAIIYSLPETA